MRTISEIEALRSITESSHFHHGFEKYFDLDSRYRHAFANDALLMSIRQVYLLECEADQTRCLRAKISVLNNALMRLLSSSELTARDNLFVCHYRAKLHYQIGVQWMALCDAPIEDETPSPVQQALAAFELAKLSYAPFKTQQGIATEDDFCQQSYALHAEFAAFDPYSPWARLISVACNYYLCAQEDENSGHSNAELRDVLIHRINKQQDPVGSPSDHTIKDVKKILHDVLLESSPSSATEKSTLKPNKRKRLLSGKAKPLPIDDWRPEISNRLDFNQTIRHNAWPIPSFLRSRQSDDAHKILAGLTNYAKPLLITKPTGTGKTALFSALTNAAWKNHVPTIIVVPSVTLVKQTRDKLLEYSQHEGMDYPLHHIGEFCPTKQSLKVGPITVVTQASYVLQVRHALERFPTAEALSAHLATSAQAWFSKEVVFHPDFFSLLIVDEGHHAAADQMFDLISNPAYQRPVLLFSASTVPGEYKELDAIAEHVVTQTFKEAIETRELAPLQSVILDFSMHGQARSLSKTIRKRLKGQHELDAQSRLEIENLMQIERGFSLTAASVLQQVLQRVPSAKKAMVFTDSIVHAEIVAKIITQVTGQPIRAYHSQASDRDEVLKAFKNDETPIIVAVGALDEGFDEPNVNVILDFSIYVSRIRRIMQRLGRALRLRPDDSGAILISVKLLATDLQLIPRDVIMGSRSEQGFLGQGQTILTADKLVLSLPAPLVNRSSHDHAFENGIIQPQSAAIVYPDTRRRFPLGMPPLDEDITSVQENARSPHPIGFFEQKNSWPAHQVVDKMTCAFDEMDGLPDDVFEALAAQFL